MKKVEPEIDHGTRRGARFFASNSGYYYLRKKISPCRTEVQQGQIWSGRSPHALYQIQPLGTCKQVDCSPTPFPVTRGVVGLIAGPAKALWRLNYWVRFICPLQPVIAATDLRTRLGRGSEPFTSKPSDTRSATAFGGALARATGLASYPSVCHFVHMTALQFLHRHLAG